MNLQVVSKTEHGSVAIKVKVEADRVEEMAGARARDVDDGAARRRFDALVALHLPALRARAVQLCRSHYDPDDVLQDALLRAFLTPSQVRDPARIRAWLLMIVTNTFIDMTRKQRRRPDHVPIVVEVPAPERSEAAPWDEIEPEDLRRAIEELPDDVRETYRMFAIARRDYAEIARAQNVPTATVGSRLFRARKQLRVLLTSGARGKAR